jgi:hypothetical protein
MKTTRIKILAMKVIPRKSPDSTDATEITPLNASLFLSTINQSTVLSANSSVYFVCAPQQKFQILLAFAHILMLIEIN